MFYVDNDSNCYLSIYQKSLLMWNKVEKRFTLHNLFHIILHNLDTVDNLELKKKKL